MSVYRRPEPGGKYHFERASMAPAGSGSGRGLARLELVPLDAHGRAGAVGANHPAQRDQLERTDAAQPRRPVHGELDEPPVRQFSFRGKENSAAAHVDRLAGSLYVARFGAKRTIPDLLTKRKSAVSTAVGRAFEMGRDESWGGHAYVP